MTNTNIRFPPQPGKPPPRPARRVLETMADLSPEEREFLEDWYLFRLLMRLRNRGPGKP